jgi:hypothetical protein
MPIDAETREAFDRVKVAIERIKDAKENYLAVQSDDTADSDDRGAARGAFRDAETTFGSQWQNVEIVMAALMEVVDCLPRFVVVRPQAKRPSVRRSIS